MQLSAASSSPDAFTRRQFVRWLAIGSAYGTLGAAIPGRAQQGAAPRFKLLHSRILSPQPELFYGWPTVARRAGGEIWVVCSGGREAHVCPFGQVVAMTSNNDGETWTWPRVLLDSAIDDRDAGIVETARGTLLVTTFTSLAYVPTLREAERSGTWVPDKLRRWQAADRRLTSARQQQELGQWMVRSTDGGVTWSARYPSIVNSPHGPVQLRDGRLLYPGKELWTGSKRVGVCESQDDGASWQWLAEIPRRKADDPSEYHELHAVETDGGRLVLHIRNENGANRNETLQCESTDGGRTWSDPHPIGVWGLPSHLLRLRDGRLLMSYGHRRSPRGNQARLSADQGRTWSEPMILSADDATGDLGYPSTIQLGDGSLLSVWYEASKAQPKAVLRQAHWQLLD